MPERSSPYSCDFCRAALVPQPIRAAEVLRYLTLRRTFKCAHCFDDYVRPFMWIGRLPLLGRLFRAIGARRARPDSLPQRPGDFSNSSRRLAAAGRWVSGKESFFRDSLLKLMRLLTRPFRGSRKRDRRFRPPSRRFRR
ncbi:MAG: hypothetical protein Fues2KO_43900 [Fuerstiella sp.]